MSEFACPECGGAAPTGTRAGAPYQCPSCGNPVLPAPRAAPAVEVLEIGPPRPPWKIALLAFVVLGAAYLGAYELLTAEAKRERDALMSKHGAAITTLPDPGPPPVGTDAATLREYVVRRDAFKDRTTYESRVSRIDMMFIGLVLAFAAQSVLTAAVLLKTATRAKALRTRSESARARSSRGPRA